MSSTDLLLPIVRPSGYPWACYTSILSLWRSPLTFHLWPVFVAERRSYHFSAGAHVAAGPAEHGARCVRPVAINSASILFYGPLCRRWKISHRIRRTKIANFGSFSLCIICKSGFPSQFGN